MEGLPCRLLLTGGVCNGLLWFGASKFEAENCLIYSSFFSNMIYQCKQMLSCITIIMYKHHLHMYKTNGAVIGSFPTIMGIFLQFFCPFFLKDQNTSMSLFLSSSALRPLQPLLHLSSPATLLTSPSLATSCCPNDKTKVWKEHSCSALYVMRYRRYIFYNQNLISTPQKVLEKKNPKKKYICTHGVENLFI